MRDGYSDRSSPHLGIVNYKSREEVFVLSRGTALVERNANDFVAGSRRLVPGAVFRGEDVARATGGNRKKSSEGALAGLTDVAF